MSYQVGDQGEEVRKIQELLRDLGIFNGNIDGIYGNRTRQAVMDFQQRHLVDGIVDEVTMRAMQEAARTWAERDTRLLLPVPNGLAEVEQQFGKIEFQDTPGGTIKITNDFAEKNIILAKLPVVGRHHIHRLMEPVFHAVLTDIKDRGLDDDIVQFGTWSPRHQMHDPKRPLSTHSWGIACDINWATNPPGAVGNMDPGIVDAFERHGFVWGGRWRNRDDMHFQLARGI